MSSKFALFDKDNALCSEPE